MLDRREERGAEAVAAGRERPQHAERPAAMRRREFLRDDDDRHHRAEHEGGPGEHLHRHELGGRADERRADGGDAARDDTREEDPPPPDAIGERRQEERRNRPEANQAERSAEVVLGDPELVGDVLEGRRAHGEIVRLEEEREGDQTEQPELAFLERRDASEKRGDPPGTAHRPRQTAGRFSTNARCPSRASSVARSG